jgi:hypothetical protein
MPMREQATLKPIVAILAGHHGPGTGAHARDNDEWSLARRDSLMLFSQLLREDLITPELEPMENTAILDKHTAIEAAATWVKLTGANACIELHYNSCETKDEKIAGNELVAPAINHFTATLDKWLSTLPNRHRAIKIEPDMLLFKHLEGAPVAIIECAFIWEPEIDKPEWASMVAAALKRGLYKYFEGWPNE